jgi:DNA-binding transcriptional ArsR family regulator
LTNKGIEEETYSVIFSSLKHPVRRKILRMLAEKPLTFSEILEELKIDSGHLSYHIENLGELVVHAQEGKYKLSSIGLAAVKLMGGVEEQPTSSSRKLKPRHIVAKIYPLILAIVLITASFYLVTFTTPMSSATLNQDNQYPTPFTVAAGQTITSKVLITQWAGSLPVGSSYGGLYLSDPNTYQFLAPHLTNRLDSAAEGSMWIDMRLNYSQLIEEQTGLTSFVFPDNLSLNVYMPDGLEVNTDFHRSFGAADNYFSYSTWGGSDHYVSSPVQVTKFGKYQLVITNNGSFDLSGTLLPYVQWQQLEKPYFYFGIAGLIIGLGYIAFVTVGLLKARKTKN